MLAAVYERYGPPEVLHLAELPDPQPGPNEVRIRVRATTVTRGDVRMRCFDVPPAEWLPARLYLGIWAPRRKVLGMELAGDVDAVGARVTRFRVGDAVLASTFEANFGGYAQLKCLPERGLLAPKPTDLSYEEAAASVGAGVTALRCLRQARLQPGQRVLIYGASGAVGTCAVQLAARRHEARVTGVCSGANLELVRSLGAEQVLDYTRGDVFFNGETYDVVFDAVAKAPPVHARKALRPGGVYLNVHKDTHRPQGLTALQELEDLVQDIEAGHLRPVIDRRYWLDEIVEAHRYVDLGHKRGNVVVMMPPYEG